MRIRATTVVAVQRGGKTALAADGQVSIEDTIFKSSASKLRRAPSKRELGVSMRTVRGRPALELTTVSHPCPKSPSAEIPHR